MSKFTKGPWRARCRDVSYKGGEWPKSQFLQWEVEGPEVPDGRGEFYQADARLIAAAPDLYEALRNILVMLPSANESADENLPIPKSFCYVRWIDINNAWAALAKVDA